MSEENENSIKFFSYVSHQHVLQADVAFDVTEQDDVKEIHISDALYAVILQKLKEEPRAALAEGKYRIALTATITDITELGDNEISQPEDQ